MYLLGYDLGSSSIKAALVNYETGKTEGVVSYPESEMPIDAPQPGWAEQDPEMWWSNLCQATRLLLHRTGVSSNSIKSIGIGYQMHGLVLVDRKGQALRPAIIWCDDRAITIGANAEVSLGQEYCASHMLNAPGNFTASKAKWVRDEEPAIFDQAWRMLLPGDYIALRLTGVPSTTVTGLSEGILWDFQEHTLASKVLKVMGMDDSRIANVVPTFGDHGRVTVEAAEASGLASGTPVTYRAGDQPNNAMALNVLNPGEVAATGGTSGVVYAVTNKLVGDPHGRVNSFAHVNHSAENPRIGVLLCINGCGIQYNWINKQVAQSGSTYQQMNSLADSINPGSDGLSILPFGNGSERMFGNRNIGSHIFGLDFNRHTRAHLYRAALEGIAFAFIYGIEILRELGIEINLMRVGNDNLFQSEIFSSTIATLSNIEIEVRETTGAAGAAHAAGVAIDIYQSLDQAMEIQNNKDSTIKTKLDAEALHAAYVKWQHNLQLILQ